MRVRCADDLIYLTTDLNAAPLHLPNYRIRWTISVTTKDSHLLKQLTTSPSRNVDLTGINREEFDLLRNVFATLVDVDSPSRSEIMLKIGMCRINALETGEMLASTGLYDKLDKFEPSQVNLLFYLIGMAGRLSKALGENAADTLFSCLAKPISSSVTTWRSTSGNIAPDIREIIDFQQFQIKHEIVRSRIKNKNKNRH